MACAPSHGVYRIRCAIREGAPEMAKSTVFAANCYLWQIHDSWIGQGHSQADSVFINPGRRTTCLRNAIRVGPVWHVISSDLGIIKYDTNRLTARVMCMRSACKPLGTQCPSRRAQRRLTSSFVCDRIGHAERYRCTKIEAVDTSQRNSLASTSQLEQFGCVLATFGMVSTNSRALSQRVGKRTHRQL